MGGSSSAPRKITIEEEGGGGVVKISEAVARRLVGKPQLPAGTSETEAGSEQSEEQLRSEVAKVQSMYEKKIRQLEKQNRELHQTTVEQFAKAVEEVEAKFLKTTASPICGDMHSKVVQCYHNNPKETLNCSQIVREYSTCVQQQRENILKTEKQVTAA